ncbi:hypothetical protein [Chryseobacterium sp. SG20098]|uniref:hypothetical protein n=1 Tax=Chryseobacterium sp. SG20098 TaxID=3074145 RepID=UPI0028831FA3|nr:hypothetical protein [Chryseobacterium sp. SG20098]WNI34683.1 hypothetical protein RHP76_11870 [Chryseobacterium sp. SG20098]
MGIKKDKRNYRKHSEENQELIKNSLLELGTGRSILLDNEDEIIAGNETFTQAEKLGIPIQIIETDGKTLIAVKRTDLATDDDARKQLAIVDNLATDKSEFDFELLSDDFDINFLEDIGFEKIDLIPKGVGENNPTEEWEDMPEFEQENLLAKNRVIVSFENDDDRFAFAKLIGIKMTRDTKSIWFPEKKPEAVKDFRYKDEE